MSLTAKLLSASVGGTDKLYVDDVFSTYLYTGNGSTQTINNGIDLAGKGGMGWIKSRTSSNGNFLFDTIRGVNKPLVSETTAAETTSLNTLTSFNANGFDLGQTTGTNNSLANYVSWAFRRAKKFFDIVTYTGNGVVGRQIPHGLGIAPGMVVVKRTDLAGNWMTWHRSLANGNYLMLNTTSQSAGGSPFGTSLPTTTDAYFSVGNTSLVSDYDPNINGATYVAYLFAHDPSADGIIQCGSFTTDGSGNATVNLGWEPQYVIKKHASGASDWLVVDSMRGLPVGVADASLLPNSTAAEQNSGNYLDVNATGFSQGNTATTASSTYIYLAIRRPNKPPTTGTEVYGSVATIGSNTYDISLPSLSCLDLIISQKNKQAGISYNAAGWNDRLRGFPGDMAGSSFVSNPGLSSASTAFEGTSSAPYDSNYLSGVSMNRAVYGGGWGGYKGVFHAFRRAPGVFDIVCYTGTGVARTVPHSLGVVPELMIVKCRSNDSQWFVYSSTLGNTTYLFLNTTAAANSSNGAYAWNASSPTSTVFSLGTAETVGTQVAYLFATKAGISKVGSYTGNSSSQTIGCGFTTGARFILIKRTDSTGDWYVWDSVRGIVSANDPHLSLNTTAAEVTTDDSVDPDSTGFIVNQVAATNINVTSASYIYLAFA